MTKLAKIDRLLTKFALKYGMEVPHGNSSNKKHVWFDPALSKQQDERKEEKKVGSSRSVVLFFSLLFRRCCPYDEAADFIHVVRRRLPSLLASSIRLAVTQNQLMMAARQMKNSKYHKH
jgi:hypothetical protein